MKDPPAEIAFELLESIALEEESTTFRYHIDRMKEAGFKLELDDFGSGHASIVGLLQVQPDTMKIDRRLITPIGHSEAAQRLVHSIVEIGLSLGISVTAEGVEEMRQAEILATCGCNTLQGYLFAKPMPAEDLRLFLGAEDRKTVRA